MKKALLFASVIAAAIAPQTTNAQSFLDSLNNVVNKVDQAITTSDRAQNSAERIMNKIPEGEETTEAEAAPAPAPEAVEPATGTTTAEEDEILRKAREIEERRILEEAERIRNERAAAAGNN